MRVDVRGITTRIAAPLLALGLLAGCGGGDAEPAQPAETVTVFSDPSEAATPEAEAPTENFDPNVGDRALQVGQSRVGREVTTTLLEVRDPYPPPDEFRLTDPSNRFVGLRLSQCVIEDPETPPNQIVSSYNGEFVAVTKQGSEYPGSGSSYNDFPLPKFPESATITPGSCVKGWMAVELPGEVQYDKFVWRSAGETLAEWITG